MGNWRICDYQFEDQDMDLKFKHYDFKQDETRLAVLVESIWIKFSQDWRWFNQPPWEQHEKYLFICQPKNSKSKY